MRVLFLVAWLLELGFTAATWFWLPEQVGDPGKTMGRSAFVLMMLALSVAVPWQCVDGVAWIARRMSGALDLPNKAYWLAPERREATLIRLREAMTPLGLLLLAHFAGLQLFMLLRSRPELPQIPQTLWWIGVVLAVLLFIGWIIQLHRRFALPANASPVPVSRQVRRPQRRPRA
ncbi:hypothetical protein J7U46_16125 [Pelomonas sp. V22]|uniref:hypothetical protein n=1 Tax=Pelomonas sp. V22 TaxID=2822139 RepID=UPI0024A912EF|nr:hypothetical protein [Pelomonas sp. V22]MDI4634587.1 hypothetical protein [Pelomonas sp. V22]